jgi:hypothetical protein
MEVTFKNTKFDLIIFSLRSVFRSKIMWILFFVVSLGVVVPSIKDLFDENYKLFIVGSIEIVLFMTVMFLGTSIFGSLWVLTTHAKDKTLNSSKKVIFSKNVILSQTDTSKSELKWEAISKIEKSNRYIYLYVSPIQAFIIPKRAFAIKSEFIDFFNNLNTLLKQCKSENS